MKPQLLDPIIKNALNEDYSWGDITTETLIEPSSTCELAILLKEDGVIAGLPVAKRVFKLLDADISFETLKQDGEMAKKGETLAIIKGKSQAILIAERVALNFMQRLSGIATLTHKYVTEIKKTSDKTRIVDTRKTTPGLRYLEKYAVRLGGGYNHRYNLSDAVLVKDNHLAILKKEGKSLQDVVKRLKNTVPHTVKIEIEVDTLEQIKEILAAGSVDTILLDNMNHEELTKAVQLINEQAKTEASGGVTLQTVAKIASTGVDFISVGALTHSALSLDIGLDFC